MDDATGGVEQNRRHERRQAILHAAEQLFMEQGVSRVSLQAIVRRSGGSLATVYDMFGNKEGLLCAVLQRHREEELGDWIGEISDDEAPRDVLLRIGRRGYAFITTPRTIAMMRIMMQHTLDDPESGREYFHRSRMDALKLIEDLFRRWNAAGKAAFDDPGAAAELFFAIIGCDTPLSSLLGIRLEDRSCGSLEWRLQPFFDHFLKD